MVDEVGDIVRIRRKGKLLLSNEVGVVTSTNPLKVSFNNKRPVKVRKADLEPLVEAKRLRGNF
jgi:hypothetical protein